MIVIGLTGGIASGKSTIAGRLRDHGLPVLDADRLVHELLETTAHDIVAASFPDAVKEGKIDRRTLGTLVFSDPDKLAVLEGILHPLVRAAEEEFIAQHKAEGAKAVVLEIPLLFETAADTVCDITLTAAAPEEVRVARAMHRTNMTEAKIEYILSRQLPEEVRNRRADKCIDTGGSLDHTLAQVDQLVKEWTLDA